MDLHRINVKFFLENPDSISGEDAFRIFNTWIPLTTDETLIDVADYSHVPEGPVTLLVGHQANYSIDDGGGQRGLLYARKQALAGDLTQRFQAALTATLKACHRLEKDADRVRFRGDKVVVVANDRLQSPNSDAAWEIFAPACTAALKKLYGAASFTMQRSGASGERLSAHIVADKPVAVETLLQNLAA
ncbi:MAG: hypothetical protein GKR89_07335 [Candidatus Latescibacteria bacterium]|nr:hypothetical protein [Candidatus Latescibacterota bacterium]